MGLYTDKEEEDILWRTALTLRFPNGIDYSVICRACGSETTIHIRDIRDARRWADGDLIQEALPYLTPSERELLLSRTCGDCWTGHVWGLPDETDEQDGPVSADVLRDQTM